MKYLLDSDGNSITIPADVYLFKGSVSFLDFRIVGEYSTSFKVPNDSYHRKTIGYYTLNQLNKVTQKVFTLYENGNKLSDGRVFIRSVDVNFDLFFVAGNTNWINQITGSIKDLDLSDYNIPFTATNIIDRASATDGVVFPVIDWAYNYNKLSNNFIVKPITGVSVDTYYDLYPCIYQHTIFRRLFDTYGIKLAGDLITDPIFNTIAVSNPSIRSKAYTSVYNVDSNESMTKLESQRMAEFVVTKVVHQTGSEMYDSVNDRLLFTVSAESVKINTAFEFQSDGGGTVYIYKNGVEEQQWTSAITGFQYSYSHEFTMDITAGDYIEVYFRLGSVNGNNALMTSCVTSVSFTSSVDESSIVRVSDVLPDTKQLDFIRSIGNRFNCIFDFDEPTQTLTISKLDRLDFADAIDLSYSLQSYSVNPNSGYGQRNYLRSTEASELASYKTNDLNFGDLLIEGDGEEDRTVITSLYSPCETSVNLLDWLISSIPLIRLEDSSDAIPYTTVTDSSGNAVFNGSGYEFEEGAVLRVDGTYKGFIVVSSESATSVTPYATVDYVGTGTGNIYKQRIVYNTAGAREFIVVPGISVNDINTGSPIYGTQNIRITDDTGTYPVDTIAWAYYTKPNIGTDLDNNRIGLNYGAVPNSNSILFSSIYNNKLRGIIKGQKVSCTFLLSSVDYNRLTMTRYVYLRTKDFEGYLLIEKISGYLNQFTPVEIELVYGREND